MPFQLWNVANATGMQSANNNRDAVNGLTENATENWVRLLKKLTGGGYWRTKRRIEIVSSHANAVQQRD